MSHIRVAVDVEAPRDVVWSVVADPRNLPRWEKRIVAVRGVPEDGLKPGSSYTTEVALVVGLKARVDGVVHEIRPPEYAEIELHGAPLRALVRTTLTELGPGRTRLEQDVEYHVRGGQVGEVLGKGLRLLGAEAILRRGVESQKRQAELVAARRAAEGPDW